MSGRLTSGTRKLQARTVTPASCRWREFSTSSSPALKVPAVDRSSPGAIALSQLSLFSRSGLPAPECRLPCLPKNPVGSLMCVASHKWWSSARGPSRSRGSAFPTFKAGESVGDLRRGRILGFRDWSRISGASEEGICLATFLGVFSTSFAWGF